MSHRGTEVARVAVVAATRGALHTGRMLRISRRLPLLVTASAALACSGWGVTLSAQAPDLRPTFGRVVSASGKPLADVVVTLVGGLPHLLPSLQDVHVVDVASDRRGRVVARLQPGLCYVAWAHGRKLDRAKPDALSDEQSIAAMHCEPQGFFAAGAMFELVCREQAFVASCTLTGDAAWQHLGALRFFAITPIPGTERELERNAAGAFALPGEPFERFEVRTSDGQPLWHTRIAAELEMPPPSKVRVLAVDPDGKPLADAAVRHRVGRLLSWNFDGLRSVGQDRMRLLGTSDAQGFCDVEVPYVGNPLRKARDNLLLFVQPQGRPAVAGGVWNRSFYVGDHMVPRIEGDVLRFECPEAEPLRGALPEAPTGTVAHLAAICKLHLQRNNYVHDARVFTAVVGEQGQFAFDDLPAELRSSRLSFVPPTGSNWQPPVFAPEGQRELPDEVGRTVDAGSPPVTLSTVTLSIKDPFGGPARGAVAFVSSGDRTGVLMRDSLLRVALDERGSTKLRLVPGNWVCVVLTADGFCGHQIELGEGDEKVEISLQGLASMPVTLLDADGDPIEGATVRARGTSTRGTSDPVGSIMQGLRRASRMHWQRLRTDKDGKVAIAFVPVEGVTQRVELRWPNGHSEEFALLADSKLVARPSEPRRKSGRVLRRQR